MKSKNKADSQCHPQKYIIFHWNLYLSLNTIPDKNQTKTFSFQSVSEIWTRVTCSCQGEADIPAFLSVVLTTFITILYFIFFVNRFFIYFFLLYFVNSYATSFSKKLCQFPYFLFKELCRCLKFKNPPWIIVYPGFYIFNVPVLLFVKIFPFWNVSAD